MKKRGIKGMLEFPCDVERLLNGNTLITDAGDEASFGSEIIEVNMLGQIVWQYSGDLKFAHSAKRLDNGNTVISDTSNDRVIIVSKEKEIVYTTDQINNGTGILSDKSHLCYPNDAHLVDDDTLLVTDRNNNRIVMFHLDGTVCFEYDTNIKHPHNGDLLKNGNIIIADSDGKRVIEVNKEKEIVWEYDGGIETSLDWPRDADRLENGNTIITDSKNNRIIEVNKAKDIVWEYKVDYFANFYDCDYLDNGNLLISDQQHKRVFEIDKSGNIIWEFRNYNNPNTLNDHLVNGGFRKITDNLPDQWILFSRFSEGGGSSIWDKTNPKRSFPGLSFDRPGALCLMQTVRVKEGVRYKLAGKLKTQNLEEGSFAYLQLAFLDSYGGLIEDAALAPKGRLFSENNNEYEEDVLEAVAPNNATAVEVRVVMFGKGEVFARNIMMI